MHIHHVHNILTLRKV